jgi:hypothetical protein
MVAIKEDTVYHGSCGGTLERRHLDRGAEVSMGGRALRLKNMLVIPYLTCDIRRFIPISKSTLSD